MGHVTIDIPARADIECVRRPGQDTVHVADGQVSAECDGGNEYKDQGRQGEQYAAHH